MVGRNARVDYRYNANQKRTASRFKMGFALTTFGAGGPNQNMARIQPEEVQP